MGRNAKTGIKFYRMDSGHILNKKVRLLFNDFGSDGYYIWSCLLDYAYGKWGYYFDTNDSEEMELFSSEYVKKEIGLIKKVIAACIKRQLFDQAVFDSYGILTSYMMQDVFLYATSERRRQKKSAPVEMDGNWLLFDFSDGLPDKLKILHVKNKILHVKNLQTRQDETETETKREGETHSHNISTKLKGENDRSGKGLPAAKFDEPEFSEVDNYFLKKAGRYLDNSKCNQAAQKFFNHYKGLGWKTANGAEIEDWTATANKWILEDLERDRNSKVKKSGPIKPEGTNDHKNRQFIESIFTEYKAGTVKEIGIPAGIFDILESEGLLMLSTENKKEIFGVCNGDILQAKKKAVAGYFSGLIEKGNECIFQ